MPLLFHPKVLFGLLLCTGIIGGLGFKINKIVDSRKQAYWVGVVVTIFFDVLLLTILGEMI